MVFIPTVIEDTGRYERAWDVYSLLLKERIIFVGTETNASTANSIVAQLLTSSIKTLTVRYSIAWQWNFRRLGNSRRLSPN